MSDKVLLRALREAVQQAMSNLKTTAGHPWLRSRSAGYILLAAYPFCLAYVVLRSLWSARRHG